MKEYFQTQIDVGATLLFYFVESTHQPGDVLMAMKSAQAGADFDTMLSGLTFIRYAYPTLLPVFSAN